MSKRDPLDLEKLVTVDDPEVLRDALRDAIAAMQAQSLRITRGAELTLALSGSLTSVELVDLLRRRLKWVFDFSYAVLCHRRLDGSWRLDTIGKVTEAAPKLDPEGSLARTLIHGQPSVHLDAKLEGRADASPSVMHLPLHSEGEVTGVLAFASRDQIFGQDDLRIAAMVGLQLGSVLRNAYKTSALRSLNKRLDRANTEQEALLRNVLPERVADELIEHGCVKPIYFERATVLFTDFVGFTATAAETAPQVLVHSLDHMFSRFDLIIERHGIEKLKTIGDAYMAVSGVPEPRESQAVDAVAAALEIVECVAEERRRAPTDRLVWDIRVGVHTGPLVAGVIGMRKFAFDVWGDTVNVASRLEENGLNGRINISAATYALVKERFNCIARGALDVRGRGPLEMYIVEGRRAADG